MYACGTCGPSAQKDGSRRLEFHNAHHFFLRLENLAILQPETAIRCDQLMLCDQLLFCVSISGSAAENLRGRAKLLEKAE